MNIEENEKQTILGYPEEELLEEILRVNKI